MPGWTVFIDGNNSGLLDAGEVHSTSDANGNYSFTGLPPGSYVVRAVPEHGWEQTQPWAGTHVVDIESGQKSRGNDFGFYAKGDSESTNPYFTSQPPTADRLPGHLVRYNATAISPKNYALTIDLPLAPAGMTVHPTLGTLIWQPTRDQIGTHQVVLRVQDGHGGMDLQSFTMTVVSPNTAPVITSTPPGPAIAGLPYVYQVDAQDADGDEISFRLQDSPTGVAIEPGTGKVTWTAAANQIGVQSLTVVVTDEHGAEARQSFDLEVLATAPNHSPEITSKPRLTARVGQGYAYVIEASDPDGDPLSYAFDAAPADMTIAASGVVLWQSPTTDRGQSHTVTIRVEDGRGGVATQSFDIQVVTQDTNSPPQIVSTPVLTSIVGRTYVYDALAEDPEGDPVVWGLDKAPPGMSINSLRGTIRWTLSDHLGSVRDLVNNAGQVLQHIHYTAFGFPKFANSVRYTHSHALASRVWDSVPGFLFQRARSLDVQCGRFETLDSVRFRAEDTNLYRFAANNPINYSDPSGHMTMAGFTTVIQVVVISVAPPAGAVLGIQFLNACSSWENHSFSKGMKAAVVAGGAIGGLVVALLFGIAGSAGALSYLGFVTPKVPGGPSKIAVTLRAVCWGLVEIDKTLR